MEDNLAHPKVLHKIIGHITEVIEREKRNIANRELLEICREVQFVGNQQNDPHLPHELAETAMNLILLQSCGSNVLAADDPDRFRREMIEPLTFRFPVQSWRSSSQILLQQYSTPASIGYLLAYLMNWAKGEKVLEPSAGTGSLAVWASIAGLKIRVNEIDPRRREFLTLLGYQPTPHDGEFINDLLSPNLAIDCVLMNPPFSANGGRTKANASKFGFRHVESALERLNKGGKFGIILGNAGGIDTKTGNEFWKKLSDSVSVKAIIKIDGREYYKNGTTVDINLIVGKKLTEPSSGSWPEARAKIRTVSVRSTEEAFIAVKNLGLRLDQ